MPAPRITPSDKIISMMSSADRKAMKLKTRSEIKEKLEAKAEADIQSEVEGWLRLNGFWPRSPAFLDGQKPPRGFFIHLNQTKKNPLVLDLLIISNSGRVCELELKTETGAVRPHQQIILDIFPPAKLARSTEEAISILKAWIDFGERQWKTK